MNAQKYRDYRRVQIETNPAFGHVKLCQTEFVAAILDGVPLMSRNVL